MENTMNPIITLAAVALGLGMALPDVAAAQTAKDLVGSWTAVTNITVRPDGSKADPFGGPNVKSLYIFTGDGRFSIINASADIPKFASNNRAQGTPEENKAVVAGSLAFFGTYSVDTPAKVLTLKVEGSTYPNWMATDQKRPIVSFAEDELKWTLAASMGGTGEVTLKRLK
jgi:Lipocalin-like domain